MTGKRLQSDPRLFGILPQNWQQQVCGARNEWVTSPHHLLASAGLGRRSWDWGKLILTCQCCCQLSIKTQKTSSLSNILRKLCEHLIGLLWTCYLKSQEYCQTRVLENENDFVFPPSDTRAEDGKQGCNNERAGVQMWTLPRSIPTHRDNF